VATAICLLAVTLHVAFIVGTVGPRGLGGALPAAATPILLTVAVVRGPFEQRAIEQPSGVEMPHGPPLDVATPLHRAVRHAALGTLAWMVALVPVAFAAVPALRLAGWPQAVAKLQGEVIHSERLDDRIVVSFAARSGERVVGWIRSLEESEWEVGQPSGGVLDDEGAVRSGLQFGLAGQPLFLGAFIVRVPLAALPRWIRPRAPLPAARVRGDPVRAQERRAGRCSVVATCLPPRWAVDDGGHRAVHS
jgi:hypothetical protein